MSSSPNFLWHHEVHKKWSDEKLVFLFLTYEPTYSREAALERVLELLEEQDVLSFQIYEITAPYDLLVRAWIPARMPVFDLHEALANHDATVTIHHSLEVVQVVHHWPWAKARRSPIGEMHNPTETRIAEQLPLRELEALNALQLAPLKKGSNGKGRRPSIPSVYRNAHLLTTPKHDPGIRFLVLVKVRDKNQWDPLQRRIVGLLNEARSVIRDPSLYRFDDQHQFLIFGHVEQRDGTFHAISKKLVSKINDYAEAGRARTYSVFFAIPGFLAHHDQLRLPAPDPKQRPEPDAKRLLEQPEGQRFEVKGSAFTELHPWITGEGEPKTSKRPIRDGSNTAINSLVRAVASLLNSDGGHILIGALERSKYGNQERFQELPGASGKGPHCPCGIEFDYGENGVWDDFAIRLRELIDARIQPSPPPRWLQIRSAGFAGKELCIIDIVAPDEWVWANVGGKRDGRKRSGAPRLERGFFVRIEGSTRKLTEHQMHQYKRENPRRGD